MKKGVIVEKIEVKSMAAEGKSLARVGDQVLFIPGVAPGDILDIKITRKRKNYLEGIPVHFHSYSQDRTAPFCNYFGLCGGCKWQHVSYARQLAYKHQQVKDNLERIGKIPVPEGVSIIGCEHQTHYRNKLEFTFSDSRWFTSEEINSGEKLVSKALGFHIPGRYDKVLDIYECHLQRDPSNSIRNAVRSFAFDHHLTFFNFKSRKGLLRNLIIRTSSQNETMVILQINSDKVAPIEPLLIFLEEKFPEITSLNYILNTKANDSYFDQEVIHFSGSTYITETMPRSAVVGKPFTFRVGPKSFYQTNSKQAVQLYAEALKMAGLTGNEVVYDLYCGTGTISCYVAPYAKKVIGVEYIPEAIEDARVNAKVNKINNTEFIAGDVQMLLTDDLINRQGIPNVIITDPPRAGMQKNVVSKLLSIAPERIIYISCNPATQARDVEWLSEKYSLINYQPIDMFPHTHHIENIVQLDLIK